MADHGTFNNEDAHANQHAYLSSVSLRDAFLVWLLDEHSQNYAPTVLANCLDNISKYVLRKKMCAVDLWSLSQHFEFQSVYNALLKDWLLRITNRSTYKVFLTAGQLYLKFLKDKPHEKAKALSNELTAVENTKTSIPQGTDVLGPTEKHDDMTLFVDFMHPERCTQTRPVNCLIKGGAVVLDKQNWAQLLVAITERFIKEGNPNLATLDRKPMYGSKMFFLPTKADFGNCSLLSNGKWINTKWNAQSIVTIIKNLCQHCGVDLDDVVITYEPKDGAPVQSTQSNSHSAYVKPAASLTSELDSAVVKHLSDVLSAHFANGYRLNSPIELSRFRSFAAEDFGGAIMLSDEELKRYIPACGTVFDGKVYPVSAEVKERIKDLAEEYFANGAQVIFFAEFYAKNENWLFRASVISEDMLIDIICKIFPKLSYTQTYFGYTDASIFAALESEVLRVWGDDVLLTYEQLAERLRYIPIERIKYALGQNGTFIRSSVKTLSHVSRIDISDEERETIREAAMKECNARGYASITDLPFGEIEERNYELSATAVHNAVFRICLSDKYDKNGKIITRKGDTLNALTIMKDYCRTIEKCSLDDLLNYEKELTGEVHRWIPMEAGNTVLVRIDKETYVADRFVHFDTEAIDAALELCIDGDYLPLKSFTTFGAFPDCGQTWNLFLLESYCRRFSKKFRFDTPSVNSRNAGAIIRKSCGLNYTEIMADAVANAHVHLTKNAICRFLFDAGYTGRSTTSKANEIIDKAKAIRERRD